MLSMKGRNPENQVCFLKKVFLHLFPMLVLEKLIRNYQKLLFMVFIFCNHDTAYRRCPTYRRHCKDSPCHCRTSLARSFSASCVCSATLWWHYDDSAPSCSDTYSCGLLIWVNCCFISILHSAFSNLHLKLLGMKAKQSHQFTIF